MIAVSLCVASSMAVIVPTPSASLAGAGRAEESAAATSHAEHIGSEPSELSAEARPQRLRFPRPLPLAAGLAGARLGWALTPTTFYPLEGGVRTAEAWRRKLLSKQQIPLIARLPRILTVSLACLSAAEYLGALPVHGARGSLAQVQVLQVADRLSTEVAACSRDFAQQVRGHAVEIEAAARARMPEAAALRLLSLPARD